MDYREPLKCKICDRMLQGGDDHYCIPCVEHLEAVIDVLKERNAALTAERDALAGLVREIANTELGRYPQFYLYLVSEWKDKAKALLDYLATPHDAKPEMETCKYCGTPMKGGRCSFCAVAGRPEVKPELKFDAKPEMVSEETCDICHGQGFLYCGNCYVDDELIVVRREDLEFAVKYLNYSEFDSYSEWSRDRRMEAKEIIDRLKAALGGEK